MNHKNISTAKSFVRILGCFGGLIAGSFTWFVWFFAIAELLGLIEEYV